MKPVSFKNGTNGHIQLHQPYDYCYRNDRPVESGVFHSHPCYEIYYFHEGQCTYLIGDRIYVLKPGDLLLMNGLTLHCPHVHPDARYVRSIVHFMPGFLEQWLHPAVSAAVLGPFKQLSNYRLTLSGEERVEFERMLADLSRMPAKNPGPGLERRTLRLVEVILFVSELCSQAAREQDAVPEKERHIQQVITFIEQNYMRNLTLSEIAGAAHLSKPYLSALFKEVTGTTVLKYVYSRRINQAKILLWLQPDLTVTEVCRTVGFKHLAHFSRMFKEMVGKKPEEYRNGTAAALT